MKIRGTASHIADKYIQLARDAQASGDPVGAENYFQHAEHYYRLIATAQEQFRQANPYYRPEQDARDDFGDDDRRRGPRAAGGRGGDQPYRYRTNRSPICRARRSRFNRAISSPTAAASTAGGVRSRPHRPVSSRSPDRLPSFITGGAPAPQGRALPGAGIASPTASTAARATAFRCIVAGVVTVVRAGDQPGASQYDGGDVSDEPSPPGRPAGE